jgi:hypothetical protein
MPLTDELTELNHQQALVLYYDPVVQERLKSLCSKVSRYSNAYEEGDYQQEAFIGICDAVRKFNIYRNFSSLSPDSITDMDILQFMEEAAGNMNIKTFAFWFLEKKIFSLAASSKEIVYDLFDEEGCFVQTLTNSEYRKSKRAIQIKGHTVRSRRIVIPWPQTFENSSRDQDFADLCIYL